MVYLWGGLMLVGRFGLVVILVSALLCGNANGQATSALMPGSEYAAARQGLLEQGYQPLVFPRGGAFDQCDFAEICDAYPEVIGCSGAGYNPCRFAFRSPDGGFLVGIASGETREQLRLDAIGAANAEDSQAIENLLAGRPEFADSEDAYPSADVVGAIDPIAQPSVAEHETVQQGADQALNNTILLGLVVVGLTLYLLPTIIAFTRRHRYRWPILGFNIGAGWSGIGWIWTLVWSVWPQGSALIEPVVGDATGDDHPGVGRG